MSEAFSSLFDEGRPVLTDGAWGTQLQARGLPVGALPDLWNLERPETVEEVPRAYVAAGSRVVLTNTFRANRIALEACGRADQIDAINRAGVAISRRAAAGRAKVFASIGPSGKLAFDGQVSRDALFAAFAEQAASLAAAGADALVIETMIDLGEALVALDAAKSTGIPVVVSLVFDTGKRQDRTMTGVTPEQAAEALAAAGADAIGANCGVGVAQSLDVCRRLRAATDRPIWIKPNAGLPEIEAGRAVYRTTPSEFAEAALRLADAGASFLGGCCGSTPEFIAALAQALSAPR
jgi:methionine synthase I (cobalamin-dependent)